MLYLDISSDHPIAADRELSQACRDLYLDLNLELADGEIKPAKAEGVASERTGFEFFHQLIVSGINLGIFAGIYNLIKLWLEQRPTCEITITYPDGSQLKASKLSLEEAKKFHQEHSPPETTAAREGSSKPHHSKPNKNK